MHSGGAERHSGRAYHLGMSLIHPEVLYPDTSDHPVAVDLILRQEPEEEEEEDDDYGKDDADDDEEHNDEGYSE